MLKEANGKRSVFWFSFLGVICFAFYLRTASLDQIPAIHEDDVEIATSMRSLLHGREYTLMTRTARPMSPFFAVPSLLAQAIFPPRIWVARLPSVLAGLLTVLLTFLLLQPLGGKIFAASASALVATLPILVYFSRFGVEQSLMGLAGLFPVVYAWRGSWKGAWLALLVALIVHPANVFLVPLVAVPWLNHQRELGAFREARKRRWLLGIGLLTLVASASFIFVLPDFVRSWISLHLPQSLRLVGALKFLRGSLNLISGLSVYKYFDLPLRVELARAISWIVALSALFGFGWGGWCLYRRKETQLLLLFLGLLGSYLSYYLFLGPFGVGSQQLRYGILLALPTIILLCAGLFAVGRNSPYATGAVVLCLSLISFAHFKYVYFQGFERRGPADSGYRSETKSGDTKLGVLEEIVRLQKRRQGEKIRVAVMNDRHVPIFKYLSFNESNIEFFPWFLFKGVSLDPVHSDDRLQFESRAVPQMRAAFKQGVLFVASPRVENVMAVVTRDLPVDRIDFAGSAGSIPLSLWSKNSLGSSQGLAKLP